MYSKYQPNGPVNIHTEVLKINQQKVTPKKAVPKKAVPKKAKPVINTVRCPFCGFHNQLPTTTCKKCKVDLHTGARKKNKSIIWRCLTAIFKSRFMSIIFSLLQVALLVFLYFFFSDTGKKSPTPRGENIFTHEAEQAVKKLNEMLGVRQTQADQAAPHTNNSRHEGERKLQEKLTPAQRYKTTNELFDIIDGKQPNE